MTKLSAPEQEWVCVPPEPTREMWAKSGDALVRGDLNKVHHDVVSEAVYKAMLAAAPDSGHVAAPRELLERMLVVCNNVAGAPAVYDAIEVRTKIVALLSRAGNKGDGPHG